MLYNPTHAPHKTRMAFNPVYDILFTECTILRFCRAKQEKLPCKQSDIYFFALYFSVITEYTHEDLIIRINNHIKKKHTN
jgi:hypothetical protein